MKIGDRLRVRTKDGWFEVFVTMRSGNTSKVQSVWRERLREPILEVAKSNNAEYTTEKLMASYR
jgi:hypothetical protein